ncbi:unnamed protein product, partial [Didymodactylos carnosus]
DAIEHHNISHSLSDQALVCTLSSPPRLFQGKEPQSNKEKEANIGNDETLKVGYSSNGGVLQCHDDDTLKYVKARTDLFDPLSIVQPLFKDLKMRETFIGPQVMHMPTPDSDLFEHYFPVIYKQPETSCYHPKMIYEHSSEDIRRNSSEWQSGCTIFREKAQLIQEFIFCMYGAQIYNIWYLGNEHLLKHISSLAQRLPFKKWKQHVLSNTKTTKMIQNLVEQDESITRFVKKIVIQCLRLNSNNKSEHHKTLLNKVAFEMHEAFQCYPVFNIANGMDNNGLTEHGSQESKCIPAITQGFLLNICPVHPMCARLAVEKLVHFNRYRYQPKLPSLKKAVALQTWKYLCVNDKNKFGNCRLYSACWIEAMNRICQQHEQCCPDIPIREVRKCLTIGIQSK